MWIPNEKKNTKKDKKVNTMNEKTAKILVQGLKDCFVCTPERDLGDISGMKNIADAAALIAYALRVMYLSFGAGQISLKEMSDLKLEESLGPIAPALSDIALALSGNTDPYKESPSVADAIEELAHNIPNDS